MPNEIETNPDKIDVSEPAAEPKNETTEVLKEIRDKLNKPAEVSAPRATEQEVRERIKQETQMTDAQLDFHAASIRRAVAPTQEKLAWLELKEEVGTFEPDIEKGMKEELAKYAPEMRGDKVLLEKIYYMELGKKTRFSRPAKEREEAPERETNVVRTRVVDMGSSHGSSVGLSSGSSSGAKISEEERRFAKKYGMNDAEYTKYRDSQYIDSFKTK